MSQVKRFFLDRCHWWYQHIILNGVKPEHDDESVRRIMLMNLISIAGVLILIPMGILALSQGNTNLFFADFLVASILAALLLYLKKCNRHGRVIIAGICAMTGLYWYLFFSGGIGGSAFVWIYTYPLFSSFLLGSTGGAAATVCLATPLLFHTLFPLFSQTFFIYPDALMLRFFPSFFVVSLYSYISEMIREKTYHELKIKNKELEQNIVSLRKAQKNQTTAHQNLSMAYQELDQIFNVAVPLCIISGDYKIERVNDAFCAYFDSERKHILGSYCFAFLVERNQKCENCHLSAFLENGALLEKIIKYRTGDRKKRFARVHSVPFFDDSNSLRGMISTFFDMTEKYEAEKKLEQTRQQLLHSERLGAIGRLSACIAHEFNNPLHGVMNVINSIKKHESLSEEYCELSDIALQECDRMKFLIRELQQFNRPSSGKKELFDIHQSIDNILLFHKKQFENKKARIEKNFDADIPQIRAIPDQIKQVLVNLLNNAADAMPDEGGTVIISTALRDNSFIIKIKDTGSGIHPDHAEKIFEPFFTTKPAVKGTGLGLPVSYGIIKSHGGDISVHSKPGQGSTFTITLPVDTRLFDEKKNSHR